MHSTVRCGIQVRGPDPQLVCAEAALARERPELCRARPAGRQIGSELPRREARSHVNGNNVVRTLARTCLLPFAV